MNENFSAFNKKYQVFDRATGEEIQDACYVLRPELDASAVSAIMSYVNNVREVMEGRDSEEASNERVKELFEVGEVCAQISLREMFKMLFDDYNEDGPYTDDNLYIGGF